MTPGIAETKNQSRTHPVVWVAAAVGAGIGIAALAYSRRPRSRWDRAKDRAADFIDTAREEIDPWMSIAAGTAAAGTALAVYLRNRKESGWQRAAKRARGIASRVGSQANSPWTNLAATAAITLASAVYANQARRRTIRGIDATTAEKINTLTEKGLQVLRRVRNISDQTAKLYPRLRRVVG